MPSSEKSVFDDQHLLRYLLGDLPVEEAERLDELSITNDDIAWRLREIENDLVDAYVRSELQGETLQQFKNFYLSSTRRRERVGFAEGLRRFQSTKSAASDSASVRSGRGLSRWSLFATPGGALRFGITVAALLVVLVTGYLLLDDMRLRREMNGTRGQHNAIEQRNRELENELGQQRASNSEALKKTENTPGSQLKTVSMLLPPPTRGLSSLKTVTVHSDTGFVVLLLELESADSPQYVVSLRDPVTNNAVWRSPEIEPISGGGIKLLSAGVSAGLLKQQNYIAEVTGMQRAGGSIVIGDYPFRVVLR